MSRWRSLSVAEVAQLDQELLRELAEDHPLHGRRAHAVARRTDCDDVAFEFDPSGLCVVHLAWAGKGDARWPRFEFCAYLPEGDG